MFILLFHPACVVLQNHPPNRSYNPGHRNKLIRIGYPSMKNSKMFTCSKLFAACILIAQSVCAQADNDASRLAYVKRVQEITRVVESQRSSLDATYNFSLLARAGLLPPILDNPNPGYQLPCGVNPCKIYKRAIPYCKSQAPHGAADCDAVSWRDYLFKGLADNDPSLTPEDAVARFTDNLAELEADFLGMSLYVSLEARGLVKKN